jgi:hypothetical protein
MLQTLRIMFFPSLNPNVDLPKTPTVPGDQTAANTDTRQFRRLDWRRRLSGFPEIPIHGSVLLKC